MGNTRAHAYPSSDRPAATLDARPPSIVLPCVALAGRAVESEDAMNWDQVKGNWKQLKGRVRETWGKLTDQEVEEAQGDREQLAGKIQERYGTTKEEAERQVDEFMAKQ